MKFRLQRVHYMPRDLEPGILYVAEKFGAAAHLCACGCGARIRTPLGPTDWTLTETSAGPTLYPSIGNWQQACQSHYFIRRGRILWATKWTRDEVAAGRRAEQARAQDYYDRQHMRSGIHSVIDRWLHRFFRR